MGSVSVVIPCRDRVGLLRRAIGSVRGQTREVLEIIVVDDGSRDDTVAVVRSEFPEVILISQDNRGVSSARNRGIGQAMGDWIALLDSDDEWLPDKLDCQFAALEAEAGVAGCAAGGNRLVHCDEIWIRNGVRVNAKRKHRKYGGWIYPHCLPLCAVSPSAALIRRDVFDDIGYFDEALPACEDYDFWLRLCAHEPVTYVDRPLLKKYGGHSDQLSRRYWGMDRFRMQALAKAIRSGRLSPAYLAMTRAELEKKLHIFVSGANKRGRQQAAEQMQALYRELLPEYGADTRPPWQN